MKDFGSPRMLVLMTFATALVLGGILALATKSWWALAAPVVLHVIGTVVVVSGVFKRMDQGDSQTRSPRRGWTTSALRAPASRWRARRRPGSVGGHEGARDRCNRLRGPRDL